MRGSAIEGQLERSEMNCDVGSFSVRACVGPGFPVSKPHNELRSLPEKPQLSSPLQVGMTLQMPIPAA
jgi:hypothetical protein